MRPLKKLVVEGRRLLGKEVLLPDPKTAARKAAKDLEVTFRVQGYVPKRGSTKRVYNP